MLNFFRQRGLSNVLYGAIIVATILTFVIEFRPNATQKTAALNETCAARVRGRCVGPKDFTAAYRMLMPSRSAAVSRRMNMKRIALDGLIERELLDDEAKRLGIAVTDAEVTDELYAGYVRVSVPAADPQVAQSIVAEMYQAYERAGLVAPDVAQSLMADRDTAIPQDFRDPKTKSFDMKIYERQVRNLTNLSTNEFRDEQGREILAAKMRDVVRGPIRVSDAEAWAEYARRYDTATLSYVPVKEAWAARWAVDVRQTDVDSWVKEHQQDVDKTVDERKKQDAPQAGHIRHILVKLPYGATDDEKGVALAKLSWAASRIKAGEAFAEVARELSDDKGSAAMGGDVGTKTDGFVAPFKAAADALKPGEITAGAVETQFGYHYIMKDDPAKAGDVEAAVKKAASRDAYAKSKATDAAKGIAKQIGDAVRRGKSVDDALKEAIAPFVRQQKVDGLKVLPAPAAAAGADAGAAVADAAAGKGGASGDKGAAAAAPPAKSFDASTDGDRPQTQTSGAFNRGGDPFQGLSPEGTASVVGFAFSAKEGDVLSDAVRTPDGWNVVQLKQHKVATREEFEKERDTFVQSLVRAKRDEALSLYVKRLHDQAKDDIKVDESFTAEGKADGGAGNGYDEDEY
jgi:peptidyl-prolyl cis-trans isomerase D